MAQFKQVYYRTYYIDTNKTLDLQAPAEINFINTGFVELEINGQILQPFVYANTGTNSQPSNWHIQNKSNEIISQEFFVKFKPTDVQTIAEKQLTIICKYYK
jgi:hypothetical protein